MILPKDSGVYCIKHQSGKIYIGSSFNIRKRITNHKWLLKKGTHANPHLQNSYNKNGLDSFSFEVLELCEKDQLIVREQYYLDQFKPEYNILKKAYSVLGIKHSEEFKAEKRKYRHTEEAKAKMSASRKGRKFSEEHKASMSKAQLGKKHTEETKEKLKALGKERGVSPQARAAALLSNRTRQRTPQELEALQRSADNRRGKPMSETHRQSLVEAWKRRKEKSND